MYIYRKHIYKSEIHKQLKSISYRKRIIKIVWWLAINNVGKENTYVSSTGLNCHPLVHHTKDQTSQVAFARALTCVPIEII